MVWKPKVNIKSSSLGWILEVAVPGFNRPEDIRVELDSKNRCVTILSRGGENNNSSGRVKTVWRLPGGADQESLRGEWQDGMARVYVSRK
jgi:HSP20 family molecular chaperone IbpA